MNELCCRELELWTSGAFMSLPGSVGVFCIKDVVSEQALTCALMSCPLPAELVVGVRIGSGLSTSVD